MTIFRPLLPLSARKNVWMARFLTPPSTWAACALFEWSLIKYTKMVDNGVRRYLKKIRGKIGRSWWIFPKQMFWLRRWTINGNFFFLSQKIEHYFTHSFLGEIAFGGINICAGAFALSQVIKINKFRNLLSFEKVFVSLFQLVQYVPG